MIKKTTEIDAILLNLNKAIDAHYQWLVSMFTAWSREMPVSQK